MKFLSTLSLRRATNSRTDNIKRHKNFYPRSPCGERLCINKIPNQCKIFLSTLSLRRATQLQRGRNSQNIISIHALLAESDNDTSRKKKINPAFLSTLSLRRATLFRQNYECFKWIFLSTLSLRRATWARGSRVTYVEFLSTLSLRRATIFFKRNTPSHYPFLSTLSLRRATSGCPYLPEYTQISIHALLAESD